MTPDLFYRENHETIDHMVRLYPVRGVLIMITQMTLMAQSVGEGDNGKAVHKKILKKCKIIT